MAANTAGYTLPLMYDSAVYAGSAELTPLEVIEGHLPSDRDLIHAISRIAGTEQVLPIFAKTTDRVVEVEIGLDPATSGGLFKDNTESDWSLSTVVTGSEASKYLTFS